MSDVFDKLKEDTDLVVAETALILMEKHSPDLPKAISFLINELAVRLRTRAGE